MKHMDSMIYKARAYLYSSLIPYAITISGSSLRTALAAAFMRSRARRSFGFSNSYLAENLDLMSIHIINRLGGMPYL